jgi:hypothetical protein
MTQWFRSSKIRVLLASERVQALQPLVALAERELGTQFLRTPDFNAVVPQPSYCEQAVDLVKLSSETQSAILDSAIPPNSQFKILRKVKFQLRTLEPYSRSGKNGVVEYPNSKGGHPLVGYIREIFQYTTQSGVLATLACIAQCSEVEEQFLGNRLELGARLCGRDVQRHVLVPIHLLAHVVRFPWSITAQLIISMHDSLDEGLGNSSDTNVEMDLQQDSL